MSLVCVCVCVILLKNFYYMCELLQDEGSLMSSGRVNSLNFDSADMSTTEIDPMVNFIPCMHSYNYTDM